MEHKSKQTRSTSDSMLDPRLLDPDGTLVAHAHLDDADVAQTVRLLEAVRRCRESEQASATQSGRDLRLGEVEMTAVRVLAIAANHGSTMTAGALSEQLRISTASTTKLLDRLALRGHITREQHPTDRRAIVVALSARTHKRVSEAIVRAYARRFEAAARLDGHERDVLIRFLAALSKAVQEPVRDDLTGNYA